MNITRSFYQLSKYLPKYDLKPLFTYVKNKVPGKGVKYYRQQQKQKFNNLSHRIQPSYWQNLVQKIQPSAAKVVNSLLDPNMSRKQSTRILQQYLQFKNYTFYQGQRTDLGCMAILVALNNTTMSGNLQEYQNRIIDFVTLSDIQNSSYDSLMLKYFFIGVNKRTTMNIQKNIRQYYRLKLVEIGLENFDKLNDKDLKFVLSIMQEALQKDKNNIITKWRFYPLMEALKGRLIKLMKQYIQIKDYERSKQIETIIVPSLYYRIMHMIYTYGCLSEEDGQILCKYIIKRDQQRRQDHHTAANVFNTLCYIPYIQTTNPQSLHTNINYSKNINLQNNNNQYTNQNTSYHVKLLRTKLLDYFQQRYQESAFCRRAWVEFNIFTKRYIIQRFFQDAYHKAFKQMQFQTVKDKYFSLRKQNIKRPQIPQFIWRLFKQNQKQYLYKPIINHLITNVYPQKISIKKDEIPRIQQKKYEHVFDNESNLKLWKALSNLGYEFKKQQQCADRQVDIVINDNVILEMDGQNHYYHLSKDLAPTTSFRNLHLLLSGYKVIIISMYQYNQNRSLQQFQNLLKQKLAILQQQNVVYVC